MLNENLIAHLAEKKIISETFRRLPPDKKERVYRTVIRLFGRYGYDGLPVDRICLEAGISKGSFFKYFQSKSHLLELTLLLFDNRLSEIVLEIKKNEKVALARDRLKYLYCSIVLESDLDISERIFYLFATRALEHAGVQIEGIVLGRHFSDYVEEIFQRGVETGEVRGDISPDITGFIVSRLIQALTDFSYSERTILPDIDPSNLISIIFDGVTA